jgi:hypothetical protein
MVAYVHALYSPWPQKRLLVRGVIHKNNVPKLAKELRDSIAALVLGCRKVYLILREAENTANHSFVMIARSRAKTLIK